MPARISRNANRTLASINSGYVIHACSNKERDLLYYPIDSSKFEAWNRIDGRFLSNEFNA